MAENNVLGGAALFLFTASFLPQVLLFPTETSTVIPTQTEREETTRPACGDYVLTGDYGTITSPNYPNQYSNNQDCIWRIHAGSNKFVELEFSPDFNIEYHPYCWFDYLRVYDGDTTAERFANEDHCGDYPPRGFESSSNIVTVVFHSDESSVGTGFSLSWSTTAACEAEEFRCWDGTCIESQKQCDGVVDCTDKSDETECARPPTTPDQCGKPDIAPYFKWAARIIGGSEAVKGSWPWQVLVSADDNPDVLCGGSLVGSKWVLTAAHCLDANHFSEIYVTIGDYDNSQSDNDNEQIKRVIMAYEPENYNGSLKHGYDIMVLELESDVLFNDYVHPICLPPNTGSLDPPPGSVCIATGWGIRHPSQNSILGNLRQIRVPLLGDKICYGIFRSFLPETSFTSMPSSQFCAGLYPGGGADACQGDSGGPLVCIIGETWYQIGVISYGASCGEPGYPGFYTRVSSYADWINQVIAGETGPKSENPSVAPTTSGVFEESGSGADVTNSPENASEVPIHDITNNTTHHYINDDSTTINIPISEIAGTVASERGITATDIPPETSDDSLVTAPTVALIHDVFGITVPQGEQTLKPDIPTIHSTLVDMSEKDSTNQQVTGQTSSFADSIQAATPLESPSESAYSTVHMGGTKTDVSASSSAFVVTEDDAQTESLSTHNMEVVTSISALATGPTSPATIDSTTESLLITTLELETSKVGSSLMQTATTENKQTVLATSSEELRFQTQGRFGPTTTEFDIVESATVTTATASDQQQQVEMKTTQIPANTELIKTDEYETPIPTEYNIEPTDSTSTGTSHLEFATHHLLSTTFESETGVGNVATQTAANIGEQTSHEATQFQALESYTPTTELDIEGSSGSTTTMEATASDQRTQDAIEATPTPVTRDSTSIDEVATRELFDTTFELETDGTGNRQTVTSTSESEVASTETTHKLMSETQTLTRRTELDILESTTGATAIDAPTSDQQTQGMSETTSNFATANSVETNDFKSPTPTKYYDESTYSALIEKEFDATASESQTHFSTVTVMEELNTASSTMKTGIDVTKPTPIATTVESQKPVSATTSNPRLIESEPSTTPVADSEPQTGIAVVPSASASVMPPGTDRYQNPTTTQHETTTGLSSVITTDEATSKRRKDEISTTVFKPQTDTAVLAATETSPNKIFVDGTPTTTTRIATSQEWTDGTSPTATEGYTRERFADTTRFDVTEIVASTVLVEGTDFVQHTQRTLQTATSPTSLPDTTSKLESTEAVNLNEPTNTVTYGTESRTSQITTEAQTQEMTFTTNDFDSTNNFDTSHTLSSTKPEARATTRAALLDTTSSNGRTSEFRSTAIPTTTTREVGAVTATSTELDLERTTTGRMPENEGLIHSTLVISSTVGETTPGAATTKDTSETGTPENTNLKTTVSKRTEDTESISKRSHAPTEQETVFQSTTAGELYTTTNSATTSTQTPTITETPTIGINTGSVAIAPFYTTVVAPDEQTSHRSTSYAAPTTRNPVQTTQDQSATTRKLATGTQGSSVVTSRLDTTVRLSKAPPTTTNLAQTPIQDGATQTLISGTHQSSTTPSQSGTTESGGKTFNVASSTQPHTRVATETTGIHGSISVTRESDTAVTAGSKFSSRTSPTQTSTYEAAISPAGDSDTTVSTGSTSDATSPTQTPTQEVATQTPTIGIHKATAGIDTRATLQYKQTSVGSVSHAGSTTDSAAPTVTQGSQQTTVISDSVKLTTGSIESTNADPPTLRIQTQAEPTTEAASGNKVDTASAVIAERTIATTVSSELESTPVATDTTTIQFPKTSQKEALLTTEIASTGTLSTTEQINIKTVFTAAPPTTQFITDYTLSKQATSPPATMSPVEEENDRLQTETLTLKRVTNQLQNTTTPFMVVQTTTSPVSAEAPLSVGKISAQQTSTSGEKLSPTTDIDDNKVTYGGQSSATGISSNYHETATSLVSFEPETKTVQAQETTEDTHSTTDGEQTTQSTTLDATTREDKLKTQSQTPENIELSASPDMVMEDTTGTIGVSTAQSTATPTISIEAIGSKASFSETSPTRVITEAKTTTEIQPSASSTNPPPIVTKETTTAEGTNPIPTVISLVETPIQRQAASTIDLIHTSSSSDIIHSRETRNTEVHKVMATSTDAPMTTNKQTQIEVKTTGYSLASLVGDTYISSTPISASATTKIQSSTSATDTTSTLNSAMNIETIAMEKMETSSITHDVATSGTPESVTYEDHITYTTGRTQSMPVVRDTSTILNEKHESKRAHFEMAQTTEEASQTSTLFTAGHESEEMQSSTVLQHTFDKSSIAPSDTLGSRESYDQLSTSPLDVITSAEPPTTSSIAKSLLTPPAPTATGDETMFIPSTQMSTEMPESTYVPYEEAETEETSHLWKVSTMKKSARSDNPTPILDKHAETSSKLPQSEITTRTDAATNVLEIQSTTDSSVTKATILASEETLPEMGQHTVRSTSKPPATFGNSIASIRLPRSTFPTASNYARQTTTDSSISLRHMMTSATKGKEESTVNTSEANLLSGPATESTSDDKSMWSNSNKVSQPVTTAVPQTLAFMTEMGSSAGTESSRPKLLQPTSTASHIRVVPLAAPISHDTSISDIEEELAKSTASMTTDETDVPTTEPGTSTHIRDSNDESIQHETLRSTSTVKIPALFTQPPPASSETNSVTSWKEEVPTNIFSTSELSTLPTTQSALTTTKMPPTTSTLSAEPSTPNMGDISESTFSNNDNREEDSADRNTALETIPTKQSGSLITSLLWRIFSASPEDSDGSDLFNLFSNLETILNNQIPESWTGEPVNLFDNEIFETEPTPIDESQSTTTAQLDLDLSLANTTPRPEKSTKEDSTTTNTPITTATEPHTPFTTSRHSPTTINPETVTLSQNTPTTAAKVSTPRDTTVASTIKSSLFKTETFQTSEPPTPHERTQEATTQVTLETLSVKNAHAYTTISMHPIQTSVDTMSLTTGISTTVNKTQYMSPVSHAQSMAAIVTTETTSQTQDNFHQHTELTTAVPTTTELYQVAPIQSPDNPSTKRTLLQPLFIRVHDNTQSYTQQSTTAGARKTMAAHITSTNSVTINATESDMANTTKSHTHFITSSEGTWTISATSWGDSEVEMATTQSNEIDNPSSGVRASWMVNNSVFKALLPAVAVFMILYQYL